MYRSTPPPTEAEIYFHRPFPDELPPYTPSPLDPPPITEEPIPVPTEPTPGTVPTEPTPEPLPTDPDLQALEQTQLNQLLALNTTETKLLTLIEILRLTALLFTGKVL